MRRIAAGLKGGAAADRERWRSKRSKEHEGMAFGGHSIGTSWGQKRRESDRIACLPIHYKCG